MTYEQVNAIFQETVKRPLTDSENVKAMTLKEQYKPYQGKSLTIGGKDYPIYNADKDFFPCGNAPEIILTDEEAMAWRQEFKGKHIPDSFVSTSMWTPFNDELFLK